MFQQQQNQQPQMQRAPKRKQQQQTDATPDDTLVSPQTPQPAQINSQVLKPVKSENIKMEEQSTEGDAATPHWMKSKLQGVKKISNKERRRRQNRQLRRMLTPKNALMVLNEMLPQEQISNQFKVELVNGNVSHDVNRVSYCAELNVDGNIYRGYGDNKMSARNAAAEQAIRDLVITKMNKAAAAEAGAGDGSAEEVSEEGGTEEPVPMMQLASFALYKLFNEWKYNGHEVPALRPPHPSEPSQPEPPVAPPPPVKAKKLPLNASLLHPCMLLAYMRPHLQYHELGSSTAATGPGYTMGVEVDGVLYSKTAGSKKEGRREAARAACEAIFGVQFERNANSNHPVADN